MFPHGGQDGGQQEYDTDGNMIARTGTAVPQGEQTLTYNALDLPLTITTGTELSEFKDDSTFAYDAGGMRVLRDSRATFFGSFDEKVTRTFTPNQYFERVDTTEGGNQSSIFKFKVHHGGPIAELRRTSIQGTFDPDEERIYLLQGRLGSTKLIVDEDGEVLERPQYKAFGAPENEPSSDIRARFTGHEQDLDIGLTNMKGRIYDHVLGRFLTPDPILDPINPTSVANRYAYVGNDSVNRWDPFGFDGTDNDDSSDDEPSADPESDPDPDQHPSDIDECEKCSNQDLMDMPPAPLVPVPDDKGSKKGKADSDKEDKKAGGGHGNGAPYSGMDGAGGDSSGDFNDDHREAGARGTSGNVPYGEPPAPTGPAHPNAFEEFLSDVSKAVVVILQWHPKNWRKKAKQWAKKKAKKAAKKAAEDAAKKKGAPVPGAGKESGRAFKAKVNPNKEGGPQKLGTKPVKKSDATKEAARGGKHGGVVGSKTQSKKMDGRQDSGHKGGPPHGHPTPEQGKGHFWQK